MIIDVKHLVTYMLAIHISSLETVYSGPLPIFKFNCFLDIELYEFIIYFGY